MYVQLHKVWFIVFTVGNLLGTYIDIVLESCTVGTVRAGRTVWRGLRVTGKIVRQWHETLRIWPVYPVKWTDKSCKLPVLQPRKEEKKMTVTAGRVRTNQMVPCKFRFVKFCGRLRYGIWWTEIRWCGVVTVTISLSVVGSSKIAVWCWIKVGRFGLHGSRKYSRTLGGTGLVYKLSLIEA